MIEVRILSRPGCHLCDRAKAVIVEAAGGFDVQIVEVNIQGDAELEGRYGWDIPVVFIDGREHCRHRVDADAFRRALGSRDSSVSD